MKGIIVGYGNVGKNLHKELAKLNLDIYDPFLGYTKKHFAEYDLAFVCVDTPMMKDGRCDLSQVHDAVEETDADIIVLKSTVPVGTTEMLALGYGKKIVFSPEYYGTTQHCNNFDFDFTILGGNPDDCHKVQQYLQKVYDARHRFFKTDSRTAELCKYMENCYLATKVSFCVQFWELAKQFGVDYDSLRELFVCDPRVGPSHTFVYDQMPYWQSHCLDKDVSEVSNWQGADFMKSVFNYNKKCIEKYKK